METRRLKGSSKSETYRKRPGPTIPSSPPAVGSRPARAGGYPRHAGPRSYHIGAEVDFWEFPGGIFARAAGAFGAAVPSWVGPGEVDHAMRNRRRVDWATAATCVVPCASCLARRASHVVLHARWLTRRAVASPVRTHNPRHISPVRYPPSARSGQEPSRCVINGRPREAQPNQPSSAPDASTTGVHARVGLESIGTKIH